MGEMTFIEIFLAVKAFIPLLVSKFYWFLNSVPKFALWYSTFFWLWLCTYTPWVSQWERRTSPIEYVETSEKIRGLLYGYVTCVGFFMLEAFLISEYILVFLRIPYKIQALLYILFILGHIPVIAASHRYRYTFEEDLGGLWAVRLFANGMYVFFGMLFVISILAKSFFSVPWISLIFMNAVFIWFLWLTLPNFQWYLIRPTTEFEMEYSAVYGYVLGEPFGDETEVEGFWVDWDIAPYHEEDEDWAEEYETLEDMHYSMNLDMVDTSNEEGELRKYGSEDRLKNYLIHEMADIIHWQADFKEQNEVDFEFYWEKRCEYGQTGIWQEYNFDNIQKPKE